MNTPAPTETFDERYLEWKDWQPREFGRCSASLAHYFAAETGLRDARGRRVLELGFGNGELLGWLRERGAEVYGVEANPQLVAQARQLLGDEHVGADLQAAALQRLAGQFTDIFALDVLEHVPQESLGVLLSQLAALLAPGGRILARFPNGDSPFGRINQHGDPTHVTTIGRAKIEYFARRAGLQVQLRAPALARDRNRIRRSLLRAGRAVVERIIGLLYFGGRRIPLDPNYVAVLTRPKAAAGG